MSGINYVPPASQASVDAAAAKADAANSKATTAETTANTAMQKADAVTTALTSADRQQAIRQQVTPDANGRVKFTYPKAYVAGTIPAVTTTAETPQGATYRNDASVEEGSANSTDVVILVQRIPKTLTASVLGAVLNVLTPVTTPVWINILVRAPV